MTPWTAIAVPTGIISRRIQRSIRPPAIPNMPESIAVRKTVKASPARMTGLKGGDVLGTRQRGNTRRIAPAGIVVRSGGEIAEHGLQDAAIVHVGDLVERIDAAKDIDLLHRAVAIGDLRRLPFARLDRPFEPRSEEHTSELQSLMRISYAVFCLKKKKNEPQIQPNTANNIK